MGLFPIEHASCNRLELSTSDKDISLIKHNYIYFPKHTPDDDDRLRASGACTNEQCRCRWHSDQSQEGKMSSSVAKLPEHIITLFNATSTNRYTFDLVRIYQILREKQITKPEATSL